MGYVSLFGTLSLLFAGPHRQPRRPGRHTYTTSSCLEGSPNGKEQPLSAWENSVEKYRLEKAKEFNQKAGLIGGQVVKEKYGSVYNITVVKYGANEASDIFREIRRKGREAFEEKYTPEEIHQMRRVSGVKSAQIRGFYTHYPGVQFRKDTEKWRVRFSCKGKKYYAGSTYETEEEAALAHDELVRSHMLNRPLHFPREGERTW